LVVGIWLAKATLAMDTSFQLMVLSGKCRASLRLNGIALAYPAINQ
jgi:hypothetical protein